jgi:hypothetical protein
MMPPEFLHLIQRYCALGRLLPSPGDLHEMRDEAALVLREMDAVKWEIDRILDAQSRNADERAT